MEFAASFIIALGLAMDAFAVSLGVAAAGRARDARARFRLAFHFGFFQMAMTVLGWLLGFTIAGFIDGFDHWIALALLGYVGVNMVRSGFDPNGEICQPNPSKGKTLIVLCVATSLDAMAVGLSMAMLKVSILYPSVVIGVVTSALCTFGLIAGSKLGETFGKKMEVLGGLLLIGIGIRVVMTHIL